MRWDRSALWRLSSAQSTSTPVASIFSSTGTSGISMSRYTDSSEGSAASFADSTRCRRSVTSASSAAYFVASSSATCENRICLAPLPATCSYLMVA